MALDGPAVDFVPRELHRLRRDTGIGRPDPSHAWQIHGLLGDTESPVTTQSG